MWRASQEGRRFHSPGGLLRTGVRPDWAQLLRAMLMSQGPSSSRESQAVILGGPPRRGCLGTCARCGFQEAAVHVHHGARALGSSWSRPCPALPCPVPAWNSESQGCRIQWGGPLQHIAGSGVVERTWPLSSPGYLSGFGRTAGRDGGGGRWF